MPENNEQPISKEQFPNVVKVRNDDRPLYFGELENKKFKFQEGSEVSWADPEEVSQKELR